MGNMIRNHQNGSGKSGRCDDDNIHSVGKLLLVSHVLRSSLPLPVQCIRMRGYISMGSIFVLLMAEE